VETPNESVPKWVTWLRQSGDPAPDLLRIGPTASDAHPAHELATAAQDLAGTAAELDRLVRQFTLAKG
jgi:hypothetical protein